MTVKNFVRPAIVALLILIIPFVLQLTIGTGVDGQGWNWTLSDFVIIGVLLYITGLIMELVLKKAGKYKWLAAALIILGFLLVYVEMAVGLFTNWGN